MHYQAAIVVLHSFAHFVMLATTAAKRRFTLEMASLFSKLLHHIYTTKQHYRHQAQVREHLKQHTLSWCKCTLGHVLYVRVLCVESVWLESRVWLWSASSNQTSGITTTNQWSLSGPGDIRSSLSTPDKHTRTQNYSITTGTRSYVHSVTVHSIK